MLGSKSQHARAGILCQCLLAQLRCGRPLGVSFAVEEEALGVGSAGYPSQFPRQLLLASDRGLVIGARHAVDLERRGIGGARGHGAFIVMPQGGRPLMGKVGVGMGCRAERLVQHIALAGYRGRSIPPRAGEELGLTKRRALPFGLALVFLLAIAGAAGHAEEILELLREVAVAIGVLAGRHREGRQMPLLVGRRAGWRGVE